MVKGSFRPSSIEHEEEADDDDDDMGVIACFLFIIEGNAGPTLIRIILLILLFMMLFAVIGFDIEDADVFIVGGEVEDIEDMDVRDEDDDDEHEGGDEIAESCCERNL